MNNKCYIGQTQGTVERRMKEHLRVAGGNLLDAQRFQWALREFGPDCFAWETLCICSSRDELDTREKEYIAKYNSTNPDYGYNVAIGGSGNLACRKIQRLVFARPHNVVLTQRYLTSLGISRQLTNRYIGSGWLARIGFGASLRPDDTIDWRGGLYALQAQLQMTIHVAARTALELRGLSHFVPLGPKPIVKLISDCPEHLPFWFQNYPWKTTIEHHVFTLFDETPKGSSAQLDCGGFSIAISSPERAIIEVMHLAKTNAEIEHAIYLMENLSTLRPQLVQRLLEECFSIKVKRLFLWSAEHVGHGWVEGLDTTQVELGSGKRQIYKGGRFGPKYQITIPKFVT